MEPHVERMVTEQAELKIKIDKIIDFQLTDKHKQLSPPKRDILAVQLSAMAAYYGALTVRLRMAGANV